MNLKGHSSQERDAPGFYALLQKTRTVLGEGLRHLWLTWLMWEYPTGTRERLSKVQLFFCGTSDPKGDTHQIGRVLFKRWCRTEADVSQFHHYVYVELVMRTLSAVKL